MRPSPVYENEEVSKFLRIKAHVFGVLEILVGVLAFGFVFLNGIMNVFFFVAPVFFVLTGILTVLAGCTRNLCLVRTSQTFNFIHVFAIAIFNSHFIFFDFTMFGIVHLVCDLLFLVFSIVVASTCCSCCCRPKSRGFAVSYMSAAVPVNSIGLLNQSDPTASPQSVMYALPSTPPPNYSPTTPAPPPYYSHVSFAHPTDNSPVPSLPPPAYDQS